MIKNKKIKTVLIILEILMIIFQIMIMVVAPTKGYYLIYDWIFYAINYMIIFVLCLLSSKNKYLKWIQLVFALILFVINTTFLFYVGSTNILVSKSQDSKNELILKEYKKMNYETVRLKRRGFIFGKKVDTLTGSSKYKTIEEGAFKTQWISGDTAIVTYKTSAKSSLQQMIFNFRSTNYVSYQYVAVSITGKWFEKGNTQNYFICNKGEIIYSKDGQLYYYKVDDSKQQGISSLIITGDNTKPSLTVVLNSDAIIGNDDLIKSGGTITICPITLGKSENNVFYK